MTKINDRNCTIHQIPNKGEKILIIIENEKFIKLITYYLLRI